MDELVAGLLDAFKSLNSKFDKLLAKMDRQLMMGPAVAAAPFMSHQQLAAYSLAQPAAQLGSVAPVSRPFTVWDLLLYQTTGRVPALPYMRPLEAEQLFLGYRANWLTRTAVQFGTGALVSAGIGALLSGAIGAGLGLGGAGVAGWFLARSFMQDYASARQIGGELARVWGRPTMGILGPSPVESVHIRSVLRDIDLQERKFGMKDLEDITRRLARTNLFAGVRTAAEFRQHMLRLMENMKKVAESLHTTYNDAIRLMEQLAGLGVSPAMAGRLAGRMPYLGPQTGMKPADFMKRAIDLIQIFVKEGYTPKAAESTITGLVPSLTDVARRALRERLGAWMKEYGFTLKPEELNRVITGIIASTITSQEGKMLMLGMLESVEGKIMKGGLAIPGRVKLLEGFEHLSYSELARRGAAMFGKLMQEGYNIEEVLSRMIEQNPEVIWYAFRQQAMALERAGYGREEALKMLLGLKEQHIIKMVSELIGTSTDYIGELTKYFKDMANALADYNSAMEKFIEQGPTFLDRIKRAWGYVKDAFNYVFAQFEERGRQRGTGYIGETFLTWWYEEKRPQPPKYEKHPLYPIFETLYKYRQTVPLAYARETLRQYFAKLEGIDLEQVRQMTDKKEREKILKQLDAQVNAALQTLRNFAGAGGSTVTAGLLTTFMRLYPLFQAQGPTGLAQLSGFFRKMGEETKWTFKTQAVTTKQIKETLLELYGPESETSTKVLKYINQFMRALEEAGVDAALFAKNPKRFIEDFVKLINDVQAAFEGQKLSPDELAKKIRESLNERMKEVVGKWMGEFNLLPKDMVDKFTSGTDDFAQAVSDFLSGISDFEQIAQMFGKGKELTQAERDLLKYVTRELSRTVVDNLKSTLGESSYWVSAAVESFSDLLSRPESYRRVMQNLQDIAGKYRGVSDEAVLSAARDFVSRTFGREVKELTFEDLQNAQKQLIEQYKALAEELKSTTDETKRKDLQKRMKELEMQIAVAAYYIAKLGDYFEYQERNLKSFDLYKVLREYADVAGDIEKSVPSTFWEKLGATFKKLFTSTEEAARWLEKLPEEERKYFADLIRLGRGEVQEPEERLQIARRFLEKTRLGRTLAELGATPEMFTVENFADALYAMMTGKFEQFFKETKLSAGWAPKLKEAFKGVTDETNELARVFWEAQSNLPSAIVEWVGLVEEMRTNLKKELESLKQEQPLMYGAIRQWSQRLGMPGEFVYAAYKYIPEFKYAAPGEQEAYLKEVRKLYEQYLRRRWLQPLTYSVKYATLERLGAMVSITPDQLRTLEAFYTTLGKGTLEEQEKAWGAFMKQAGRFAPMYLALGMEAAPKYLEEITGMSTKELAEAIDKFLGKYRKDMQEQFRRIVKALRGSYGTDWREVLGTYEYLPTVAFAGVEQMLQILERMGISVPQPVRLPKGLTDIWEQIAKYTQETGRIPIFSDLLKNKAYIDKLLQLVEANKESGGIEIIASKDKDFLKQLDNILDKLGADQTITVTVDYDDKEAWKNIQHLLGDPMRDVRLRLRVDVAKINEETLLALRSMITTAGRPTTLQLKVDSQNIDTVVQKLKELNEAFKGEMIRPTITLTGIDETALQELKAKLGQGFELPLKLETGPQLEDLQSSIAEAITKGMKAAIKAAIENATMSPLFGAQKQLIEQYGRAFVVAEGVNKRSLAELRSLLKEHKIALEIDTEGLESEELKELITLIEENAKDDKVSFVVDGKPTPQFQRIINELKNLQKGTVAVTLDLGGASDQTINNIKNAMKMLKERAALRLVVPEEWKGLSTEELKKKLQEFQHTFSEIISSMEGEEVEITVVSNLDEEQTKTVKQQLQQIAQSFGKEISVTFESKELLDTVKENLKAAITAAFEDKKIYVTLDEESKDILAPLVESEASPFGLAVDAFGVDKATDTFLKTLDEGTAKINVELALPEPSDTALETTLNNFTANISEEFEKVTKSATEANEQMDETITTLEELTESAESAGVALDTTSSILKELKSKDIRLGLQIPQKNHLDATYRAWKELKDKTINIGLGNIESTKNQLRSIKAELAGIGNKVYTPSVKLKVEAEVATKSAGVLAELNTNLNNLKTALDNLKNAIDALKAEVGKSKQTAMVGFNGVRGTA